MTPLPVDYTKLAAEDVAEGRIWYAAIRSELETDFAAQVDAAIAQIAVQPALFAVVYRDLRRRRLRRFPYVVYYRLRGQRVEVVAVIHDKQDPATWQSRA